MPTTFTFRSTIKPASGGDGPFWIVTENPQAEQKTVNVTLGSSTIGAAFLVVTGDIGPLLSGLTFDEAITTVFAHSTS